MQTEKNGITSLTIGCAIITHSAKKHLPHCLPPLLKSPLKPRVLVVNSSSNDGTVELAKDFGAETLVIPRKAFNHGATRETARRYLNTDIICMHTPDAYLIDEKALGKLVAPILRKNASVAYARQIPHQGADFFESFPRSYNYPEKSHLRGLDNMNLYGIYTFFCSDSCAAYSNSALESIGGFQPVLLGEDTVAVATMLRQGHHIAYVAESLVRHSHRYSLWEEFCRSFDTGLSRKNYAPLLDCTASDTKRGIDYALQMMQKLKKEAPHKLPYAFAHCLVKWLGYRLGYASEMTPTWFKKALSTQDYYWNA